MNKLRQFQLLIVLLLMVLSSGCAGEAQATPTSSTPPSNNLVSDQAVVGGGVFNQAGAFRSVVSGGSHNNAAAAYATIGGGSLNTASGERSVIGGGVQNTASAFDATIGGGSGNQATGQGAAVGGGGHNIAGHFSFVGGGLQNTTRQGYAAICGGVNNLASGSGAFIGGGSGNQGIGNNLVVAGGLANTASGTYSVISGGRDNQASGFSAVIPGGAYNIAAGDFSMAAGQHAVVQPEHDGTFVFADSLQPDFVSTTGNEFAVRATGGVRLVTAIDASGTPTAGVNLAAGSGSWSIQSDLQSKVRVLPADNSGILAAVSELPVYTWQYQSQQANIRHIGPMAQDFYAAFGFGEDAQHISSVDANGVTFAALQETAQRLAIQETQIAKLSARLAALEQSGSQQTANTHTASWIILIQGSMIILLLGLHLKTKLTPFRRKLQP